VNWANSVPNLLIGLREGLEAGLVVSILLAAVHKTAGHKTTGHKTTGHKTTGPREADGSSSTAPVWLGVLGAVTLSGSFAAVLTFTSGELSSRGQQAVSGLLSVLAVGLVTAMVFWMRRAAAGLATQLRGEVARSAAFGAGALTVTAFLSVAREGLETTLFLWTTARASGQTVTPLIGALTGLAAAIALCLLLYRRAIRLNVGRFFSRTAPLLIVVAAGVLAYGLGDLQDAGLLPGHAWVALDLTGHIDPASWWASLITGVTNLTPAMTVLQVTAWLAYLAVVLPAFLRSGRAPAPAGAPAPATAPAPAAAPDGAKATSAGEPARPSRWPTLAARRPWAVAGVVVMAPVLVAGLAIAALPSAASQAAVTGVTVTSASCAPEWTAAQPGTRTFTVANKSTEVGEITLVNAASAIVGEIETLGPATSAPLTATLGAGSYTFRCRMGGHPVTSSQPVQVAVGGSAASAQNPAPVAVKPVSLADLAGPNREYEAYAAAQLATLANAVTAIQADLRRAAAASHGSANHEAADYRVAVDAARRDWLTAQQAWERVGASYNSFGDLGTAVDGLPDGLPAGPADPAFTGLHRLEYGLFHGQPPSELLPVTATLAKDVATVRTGIRRQDLAGDPANLPLRAHEILEDALRDHLSGKDDQGAGAAYPMTAADLAVTRELVGYLAPLLNARQPGLVATIDSQLTVLSDALGATKAADGQWRARTSVPFPAGERVDAATGAVLESLASIPTLLEVPPAG
jgi:high-affinity iron transporter